MKILIIGASGRTGNLILVKALKKGYKVRTYVRNIKKLTFYNNLEVVQGELDDVDKLSQAMLGVDAVLVALGNKVSQMSNPLFTFAIPNIIKGMEIAGISRIINLSALGVGSTYLNAAFPCNIFAKTILKANFEDHYIGEKILENTDLEWTSIHPALLYTGKVGTESPKIFNSKSKTKVWGLSVTSRHDIATLMIDIIKDESSYKKKLIIVSKRYV
ncbi:MULTISPECIES: NAD(P)-dependent oxidoreductase [unclassified Gemella]|uniref:NAD(P)-dependent oxidoreductase n=1 Tax=unclassified Gemella TaxID=2624949 RepID=UPI00143094A0|nr:MULTISPECIES: NAD(P)-binding oxidoreductase [unclassified Gemella]MBF0709629.1 SDR family oxidoreductase [Gemella sp. GL1.1]MBF0746952.1 SDR family oxidoreductase [Gemella sp. 19428wG2_WT2a]NYS26973.1 SDR family oxidoreductase [Gemella sp. GL1]